jgi:predicted transposase/invertase (TIGR01784 family)
MSSRYLDPKNDLAFKKVFGAEKHKRIPMDFLNAVFHFKGEDTIIDLEFLNPKQAPEIDARKESIVDLLVKDQKGTKYIIEMQVAKVEGFEKRAQYYAAKTYCAHFGKGEKYHDLKKVIFLAITDYIVFPQKKDFKSDHVILDNKTYEHDLKDFSFTFVELPKFKKPLKLLQTIEDKWYYFLKHADESPNIAEVLAHHPEIKEAYEILDRYHWTENEIQWYEKFLMNTADSKGIIDAARNDGKQEAWIETAKILLSQGFSVDQIVSCTKLSADEVSKLQNELSNSPI